jgi:hypothetical protein
VNHQALTLFLEVDAIFRLCVGQRTRYIIKLDKFTPVLAGHHFQQEVTLERVLEVAGCVGRGVCRKCPHQSYLALQFFALQRVCHTRLRTLGTSPASWVSEHI